MVHMGRILQWRQCTGMSHTSNRESYNQMEAMNAHVPRIQNMACNAWLVTERKNEMHINCIVLLQGVSQGLSSLHEGGIRPQTLIIDDGWQMTQVDEDYEGKSCSCTVALFSIAHAIVTLVLSLWHAVPSTCCTRLLASLPACPLLSLHNC